MVIAVAVFLVVFLTGSGPGGPKGIAGEKIEGQVAQVGGVVMRADIPDGSAALTVAPRGQGSCSRAMPPPTW